MKLILTAIVATTGAFGLNKYQSTQHYSVIHGMPIGTSYEQINLQVVNTNTPKAVPCKPVKVDYKYRITNHSVITGHVINEHLKGVLKGKGDVIIEAARENNICPIFFTAVIMHESACGTSKFARERNNVAGIYRNKSYCRFDSVNECIEFTAKLLGGKLYGGGRNNTIDRVQAVYCPVGAKNDPQGINKYWRNGVLKYMKTIFGDTVYVHNNE